MKRLIPVLLILLLASPVLAEQVVVNSQDWRDVYTGLQYAASTGQESSFVVNTQQGADLAQRLGSDTDVLLINGRQQAMPGFASLIRSRGYDIEVYESDDPIDTNIEFALRAPTENVVVVDDAYGYAAVSVATYAKMRNASVVLASPQAADVIQEKSGDETLLYGHIPSAIYEELSPLATSHINEQDRFENNFALVQRYTEHEPSESIILSNGEFIESQLISGDDPLLFIGRQTVPDDVVEFIEDEGFRIAVLVGNALAPNAKYIKDETGISVFIKFAQGRNERQYALDLFQLPIPNPLIQISQAQYDPQAQSLQVTYENPGEVPTYFTASYTTGEGTFEDQSPVFLEAGTHKTVSYEMPDPSGDVPYTLLYGASPNTLELIVQGNVTPETVTVEDESEIDVVQAVYDTDEEAFRIRLENPGPVDAYALVEAAGVRIGADRVRLAGDVTRVRAGEQREVLLPASLSERDLERNQELSLEIYYGQREFSLVKFERATLAFTVQEGFPAWVLVAAVLVALLLAYYVLRKKR